MSNAPTRLLTLNEVIARVGLQKSWLYAAIKNGDFPAPIRSISTRRTLFSSADIDRWVDEKTGTNSQAAASEKARGHE